MNDNQPKDIKLDFANETGVIAFLDLTNMFHWQDTLKWNFSIYHVIKQLLGVKSAVAGVFRIYQFWKVVSRA